MGVPGGSMRFALRATLVVASTVGCDGPLFFQVPEAKPPTQTGSGGTAEAPQIVNLTVAPPQLASGDQLTVRFSVSVDLPAPPDVRVGTALATLASQQLHDFVYTYTAAGTEPEG